MTSPNIRIDRLSLRVPGLDESAARELAQLVALRLAAGEIRASPARLDLLSVSVKTGDTEPDALAEHIVGAIHQAMVREAMP